MPTLVVNKLTGRKVVKGGKVDQISRLPDSLFCATQRRKFPVDTLKRAHAALAYARYDVSPAKVKACARKRIAVLKKSTAPVKRKKKVQTTKKVVKKSIKKLVKRER
jgi:hypothetical protein